MEIKNKNLTCFVLFLNLPCREVKWKLFYDAKTKVDALTVSSRVSSLVINLLKLIERFSYDLEMKAREQNRNDKRTEIERFD